MSVTSFSEIKDGRDGTDEGGVRRYTRVFRATTDSNTDAAYTIFASGLCPTIGAPHPTDITAYLQRRHAVSPHKRVWIVTCSYSNEREQYEDPEADPVDIEWTTEQFSRIYSEDKDGKAITTTAKDPYDPPVEGDDSRWTATVTRNVSLVPTWLLNYQNAINSDSFTIDGISVPARRAKMQSIRLGPWRMRNDVPYRQLQITLSFQRDSFVKKVPNYGFRELVDGQQKEITIDGKRITTPVPLDASGARIASPTDANIVINEHHIYPELAFSSLPLS